MSELKQRILDKMRGMNLWGLANVTREGKPWVRYVSPTRLDQDLTIWCATFAGSRKVAQIAANPEVHLTMGMHEVSMEGSYLQVQARAQILTGQASKKAAWSEHLARIFQGPDDPNFAVLKIVPYRVELMTMGRMEPEVWEA